MRTARRGCKQKDKRAVVNKVKAFAGFEKMLDGLFKVWFN